jgi:hypothetical protein
MPYITLIHKIKLTIIQIVILAYSVVIETNDKIFLKQLLFINKSSFPINSMSVFITIECGEYKSLVNSVSMCDI